MQNSRPIHCLRVAAVFSATLITTHDAARFLRNEELHRSLQKFDRSQGALLSDRALTVGSGHENQICHDFCNQPWA